MKNFIALVLAILMVITVLPFSFAETNKTIISQSSSHISESLNPIQKPSSNDLEPLKSVQEGEKELPSLEENRVEWSTGINENVQMQTGIVASNPLKVKGSTLYAFESYPGKKWISFDTSNHANITDLSNVDDGLFFAAEYFQGNIYAVKNITADNSYVFGTVDPETYVFTKISDSESTQGLAMDYSTETMYALCENVLKTVDLTSGTFTTINTISSMSQDTFPITFAITTEGRMYAIEIGKGGLYEIDKVSGITTYVGPTGLSPNFAQSATFDHATRTFYWAAYTSTGILTTVDLKTGAATIVGPLSRGAELTCLITKNDNVVLPDPVPVSGVEISPVEAMMPEQGRTLQMSATVLPLGAYILDQSVTWASSNTDVATVNEAGLVTSVNCGVTTITVTTNDGEFTATSTVTVLTQAEADIKLNEALNAEGGNLVFRNDTVYPWELCTDGDRFCAHSTNNRIDNSESSVTLDLGSVIGGSTLNWDWKASSEEYDGLVIYLNDTQIMGVYANAETPWTNVTYTIPQSLSSCVIRWSFFKNNIDFAGKDMSWLDNVSFVAGESAPVTGITLRPKTKILLTGKSLRMKYNILPMNADNPNVSWSSSNTAIATVNSNGIVATLSAGEVTITVTTESGNFSDSAVITVMDMPTPITHQEMNYVPINIGDVCDFQLGLGTSTYIIKPKRNGDPGPYKTWAVGYSLFLEEGMGAGLEASGNLSNVNAVMWAFDEDFNVVAYNDGFNGGLPTHIDMVAAHTGTYNILVTGFIEFVTGAGSFSVLDYDPIRVTGVSVSPTDITVALGRYGDLTATITPENADYKACLWTISDPTIASINSRTGRLFGLKEGTAIVTATTRDGGFTATSNVTVAFVPNPEYDGLLYGFNLANPGGLPMGFVNIDPLDGESMQLLNPNFYNLYAGEYYNGLIYAYALVDYGIFQVKNFYIIDALTWELQVDIPMITQVCYDMAYDYSTDTMYGLTDNADGVRILGIVDMATGLITEIGPITMDEEENAVTLACDNSGVLYTISNAGILYKITDKTTLAAEKIGNTGYSVKYVQSMTYDHIGQSLYWGNISTDDTSHLLKIDKETGVCLSESALGVGVAEVTALFALANPDQIVETPVDPIPVEGVSITPEISTLEIGEKIKLKPIFAPTNANDKRVTWYSTSDAIATVSTKGIVTANAPGSCDIVVTTVDGEFTAKALISVNVIAPSQLPTGYCRVTLTNLDVWGNGIGYQMLLDSAHCSYGTTISSTEESLTPSGDVPQEIYDLFDHKIPKNADGALDTQNKVVNGSVSILVPEGIYDFCVVLPIQGDKMWFATNGCADDFVMTAGNEYTFTISLDSGSDMCTWTNQWIGFSDPIEMVTVTFLNFDDSIIATSIVEKGTTALAPNVPIRIGYTFIGWDKEITNVQTDMTVKAVFERLANWADVNGDGVTNTGDVSLILAYLVRKVELTPDQMIVADANGDGNVNSGDAATTMEFALVN